MTTAEEPLPEGAFEVARQFMEDLIPFNKVLGIKLKEVRRGFAHLHVPFKDELVGDPFKPALHGGVLSALADTAGGCAVFTVIEPGSKCSTIDLRIDYLRPGKLEALDAKAKILRVGGRVAVSSIEITQPSSSEAIAHVMAVYSVKRQPSS